MTRRAAARANRGRSGVIRAFDRYELKYLVDRRLADEIRADVEAALDPDPYSAERGYVVSSLYYDTADLRCYWEKIDGVAMRRKLRIRHYQTGDPLGDDTPVHVEIKQRFDRTIRKRRAVLSHAAAVALCRGEHVDHEPGDGLVAGEVRTFVAAHDLRPASIVGYRRVAYVGRGHDHGLRVTFDGDMRSRTTDLDLASRNPGRHMVHPEMVVLEVKADERVPLWLADLIGRRGLRLIRVSKYCQSIETAGRVPRSVFHMPEPKEAP